MAIKIDLLPKYVGLRRALKWWLLISFVGVTAVGSVLYLLYFQKKQIAVATAGDLEMWKPRAALATSVAGEATAKEGSLGPMQATVQFFADATQTGPRRAAAVDLIRRYVMPDALVSSIDISDGKSVSIIASVADSDDYSRLLLNLRQGTLNTKPAPPLPYVWAATPTASGFPGYPLPATPVPDLVGSDPVPKTFPVNLTIAGPLLETLGFSTPIAPGESAGAAAPGAPGSGSSSGSSSSGSSSSGPSPGPTGSPTGKP